MRKGVSACITSRLAAVFLAAIALGGICTAQSPITAVVTVGDNGVNSGISYTDNNTSGLNAGATSNPADTEILLGDSVNFVWGNSLNHSVTSTTDSSLSTYNCSPFNYPNWTTCPTFPAPNATSGSSGAITPGAAGFYYYDCTFHGSAMNGFVHVRAHGTATHFVVSNPGTQTAGVAFSVTVTAKDRNNNDVTDYPFSGTSVPAISATEGGSASISVSNVSGATETLSITLHTAESQNINANDGTASGNSGFFTVNAAPATHYVLSGPSNTPDQGASFGVTVTAEDQFGNASNDNTTVTLSSTTDTLATTPSAAISGTSTFISGIIFRTTGSQNLTASGDLTLASESISVGATHFAVALQGSSPDAGSSSNFTVTAEDSGNATVTNFADSVQIISGDSAAVISPSTSFALASGVGTFSITFNTTGSQTVTANDVTGTQSPAVTGGTAVNVAPACPDAPKTFKNTTAITINGGQSTSPYPSQITVSDTDFPVNTTIGKITVTFDSYTSICQTDPAFLLIGPDGREIVLQSMAGNCSGSGATVSSITFDDDALSPLPQYDGSTPIVAGTFKPSSFEQTDPFCCAGATVTFVPPAPTPPYNLPATDGAATLSSVFGGTNPVGTWSLYALSQFGIGGSSVDDGWSMVITPAQTFSNTAEFTINDDTPLNGPTSEPFPSPITVSGVPGNISKLTVTLHGFQHTFISNVDMLLVGPQGQQMVLMSHTAAGETGPSFHPVDVTFDDDASHGLPSSLPCPSFPCTPLPAGVYGPTAYAITGRPVFANSSDTGLPAPPQSGYNLPAPAGSSTLASVFNGTDPNGTWYLYVQDNVAGDVGNILNGWSLNIDTICPAATTSGISLTAGSNPSIFGHSVTFTSTVNSASGTPTGTVTFFDGATQIGTPQTLVSGSASIATSTLADGSHNITAVYAGNTSFATSTSGILVQQVNPAADVVHAPTVTPAGSSVFNQPITIHATVTSAFGTPDGTVTFTDNGVALPSADVVLSGGTAAYTISTLAVGAHSFRVQYSGSNSFAAGTSAATAYTVNKGPTSTVVVSGNPTSVFSQPVKFTATVTVLSPSAGSPAGTVTFFDGATQIGVIQTLVAGSASVTTAALSVGAHQIKAVYSGNGNFATSTATQITQTVNMANTTSGIGTSLSPSTYGQNVTFTVTVSANAPATSTPTGNITFTDNGFFLGSGVLSGGKATLTTNMLTGGSHTIGANYSATANFNSSSATVTQNVNPTSSSTTVALTSGTNPSIYGNTVTFTATINVPASLAAPTGSVTFFDGATNLGTVVLTATTPPYTAALSTAGLAASATAHSITAQYSGDPASPGPVNYNGSTSAAISQVVNKASTTTAVTSNVNPSTFGQSVIFTAFVSAVPASAGTPVGTVKFFDGAAQIGTQQTLASGQARVTISTLAAGNHTITATFTSTSGNFASSTGPLNTNPQVVRKALPTVTVTASPNPAFFRQTITLTANVSSSGGTPTGTVSFSDNGVALPGCSSRALSGGSANCNVMPSTVLGSLGTHTITAAYSGDNNFSPNTGTSPEQRAPAPRRLPQP